MVIRILTGCAWCFGDNINTDLIFPGRFLSITDPEEMGRHALAGLDEDFSIKINAGDFIIAGNDFGCGSSREQAAITIKHAGIAALIARSFARIFYRNIINQGVPAIISTDALEMISNGDKIEIDLENNRLKNLSSDKFCNIEPLPEFILEIIDDGGIIPHLNKKLKI